MSQGLLTTLQPAHSLSQPYRREAFPLYTCRVRESLQRAKQYEAARARLPHWPRRRYYNGLKKQKQINENKTKQKKQRIHRNLSGGRDVTLAI